MAKQEVYHTGDVTGRRMPLFGDAVRSSGGLFSGEIAPRWWGTFPQNWNECEDTEEARGQRWKLKDAKSGEVTRHQLIGRNNSSKKKRTPTSAVLALRHQQLQPLQTLRDSHGKSFIVTAVSQFDQKGEEEEEEERRLGEKRAREEWRKREREGERSF